MEIKQIITENVKTELSQFGLNEVERKEFETIIEQEVGALDETSDKTEYIKKRAKDFQPTAKLIQQSRTKYLQDLATKQAELDKLKLKTPPMNEERKENGGEQEDIKSELEKTLEKMLTPLNEKLETLAKENNDFKRNELIKTTKEKVLTEAKSKYSEGVIAITAKSFDFSVEDASDKFNTLCADNSKLLGFPLKKADEHNKDGLPPAITSFLSKEKEKAEAVKAKAETFNKLLKK